MPESERYAFTWAGKRDALRALQAPSPFTLVPVPDQSVGGNAAAHLFIEGDNLEALKLLRGTYGGRVKMIYIDPPYNTGKRFIYPDNFVGSGKANLPDRTDRRHSAWLSMMYPRLFLARQLLTDDGVLFVSIDDGEVHNLRLLLDEVFGAENFVANVIWEKKYAPQNDARWFSDTHDHILVYARHKDSWRPNLLPRTGAANGRYRNPDNDPRGPWKASDLSVKTYSARNDYPITTPGGRVVRPPESRCWAVSREKFQALVDDGRIWFGPGGNNVPALKRFRSEVQDGMVPRTIWYRDEVGDNQEAKQELKALLAGVGVFFDTPKPVRLVRRMLQLATRDDEGAIILDFFAGSCTTAQAVMELNHDTGGNRRFICVQLPAPTGNPDFPTIADIGRERIRRVAARLLARAGLDAGAPDGPAAAKPAAANAGYRVLRLAPPPVQPPGTSPARTNGD